MTDYRTRGHTIRRELSRYALLAAVILVSGCAHTRVYPLCVYGRPPSVQTVDELRKNVRSFIVVTAGEGTSVDIGPNDRVVAVKTFKRGHERLLHVWSRAACIGPTRDELEYKDYKQCVELIDAALKKNGIPPLGEWSDGLGDATLYCGQSVGEP